MNSSIRMVGLTGRSYEEAIQVSPPAPPGQDVRTRLAEAPGVTVGGTAGSGVNCPTQSLPRTLSQLSGPPAGAPHQVCAGR